MIDKAYGVSLLPESFRNLSFSAANDIESNLYYLMLIFPYFSGSIRSESIGSYGYLELTEYGSAGDGFDVESAIRIDKIRVTVSGEDLSPLSFRGSGWIPDIISKTSLVISYVSDAFMGPEMIQEVLNDLQFASSTAMDATITMQVCNTEEGDFSPLGPVSMLFRDGATWSLIEGFGMTWGDIESNAMDWNSLENMKKH